MDKDVEICNCHPPPNFFCSEDFRQWYFHLSWTKNGFRKDAKTSSSFRLSSCLFSPLTLVYSQSAESSHAARLFSGNLWRCLEFLWAVISSFGVLVIPCIHLCPPLTGSSSDGNLSGCLNFTQTHTQVYLAALPPQVSSGDERNPSKPRQPALGTSQPVPLMCAECPCRLQISCLWWFALITALLLHGDFLLKLKHIALIILLP